MTFDPTKPCRTKSGLPARYLGKLDNPTKPYTLLFATGRPGQELLQSCTEEGYTINSSAYSPNDLENIPITHTRELFLSLLDNGTLTIEVIEPRRTVAGIASKVIACKRITVEFEEGEG